MACHRADKMSSEKVRRFVPYKPNAQVMSFFHDLKKRKISAPSTENVTVSSKPIPKSGGSLKSTSGQTKTKRSSTPRRVGRVKKKTSVVRRKPTKKKKKVDSRLKKARL